MSTTPGQRSEEDGAKPSNSPVIDSETLEVAKKTAHESTDGAAPSQPTTAPSQKALCGVCDKNPPKYKCPRCFLPYCSVACNKTHRENHPPDPEPAPKRIPTTDEQSNAATTTFDHANPFRALEKSDQLRRLFQKYPSLPDQLLKIHAATLPPPDAASQHAGIPASLLKGLPKKESWNHDIGIQNGKEALRKARGANGEEGDGIREYSELILHLINTAESNSEVTDLLRQQLAQEDTKLIERLMAEERR